MPQPAADRWRAIVARARQSGLSMNAFARANGLNPSTLAWWSWRLGHDASSTPSTDHFVEAVLVEPTTSPPLTVRVGTARLDVYSDTDLDLLRRVVETLA